MSVREPLRIRKALLAGVVALALTGTGVAIAWSATGTPSPSPSPSASEKANGQENPAKAQRPQRLHGESVVKKADGTLETVVSQQGTVDAVSATSVTVKSEDGFTQSYTINGDTRIVKIPADTSQLRNGKGKLPSATAADLKAGDTVRIAGTKDGSTVTATRILAGQLPDKVPGTGNGKFKGPGHRFGQNPAQNS
ncbi:MAG TPA: DUF5666 domain-containing protein [Arthrobacter sp.]|nr:DUF5666 domain-containing protein [Arthrobacter sp.]